MHIPTLKHTSILKSQDEREIKKEIVYLRLINSEVSF